MEMGAGVSSVVTTSMSIAGLSSFWAPSSCGVGSGAGVPLASVELASSEVDAEGFSAVVSSGFLVSASEAATIDPLGRARLCV